MTKSIVLTVALMGVGGFALGWLAFGTPARPPKDAPAAPVANAEPSAASSSSSSSTSSPTTRPVEVERRYVLKPEDVQADRETPAVAVDGRGRVVVAWASQTGPLERTIYLLRSSNGGTDFAAPVPWRKVPIYRFQSKSPGKAMTFSTHVLPRLTSHGDSIWLGWVEAVAGGPEVRYLVARSTDGGQSFSEPIGVHGDKAVRPGFTSLSIGADGALCASWLDGRGQGQQPFVAVASTAGGTDRFGAESLVFAGPDGKGICPCCDLAVARSAQGTTFVAFRNSESGTRDITIARSQPGETLEFGPPTPATPDRWSFDGCPHDGPSLALRGDRLHALWMDAHSGKNRVYTASSPLDSLAFSPREIARTPGSQGHPKLVADASGVLHAVWDESLDPAGPAPTSSQHGGHAHGAGAAASGSGRAIMYATATGGGEFGPPRALAPHPGAFQLNPALAIGPAGDVFIAWNELDAEGKQVVMVKLPPAPSTQP